MNIAIFGGSFNPVHMGHYEIVRNLVQEQGFKSVLVVPTYQNPLKSGPPVIPEAIRWQMLQATFDAIDAVELSRFEIETPGISYSYKTLTHFRQIYPEDSLFLILGEDSFASFPQWVNMNIILEMAHILVFPRCDQRSPDVEIPFFHNFREYVTWLDITIPDISATNIRNNPIKTVEENGWLHPSALIHWKAYRHSEEK